MKSLRGIVVILILASSVYLWAGSAAHAGGSTGNSSPAYDPFEGDVVGFVQIRELELEALQAEIEAAEAELDRRIKEQYTLELLWALFKEYVPKAMPTPATQLTTSAMLRLLELAILD